MALFNLGLGSPNGGTISNTIPRFGVEQLSENRFIFAFPQATPNNVIVQIVDTSNGVTQPTISTQVVALNINAGNVGIKINKISDTQAIIFGGTSVTGAPQAVIISIDINNNITVGTQYTFHSTVRAMSIDAFPTGTPGVLGFIAQSGSNTSVLFGQINYTGNTINSSSTNGTGSIGVATGNFLNIFRRESRVNPTDFYYLVGSSSTTSVLLYKIDSITNTATLERRLSDFHPNVGIGINYINFSVSEDDKLIMLGRPSSTFFSGFIHDPNQTIQEDIIYDIKSVDNGTYILGFEMLSENQFFITQFNGVLGSFNAPLFGKIIKYTGSSVLPIFEPSNGFIQIGNGTPSRNSNNIQLNRNVYNINNSTSVVFFATGTTLEFFIKFIIKPQ